MRILLKQNEASFKQLFNDYLISCKARGLADKTIASYNSHLHSLGNYLNLDTTLEALQKRDIDKMIGAMREKGLSANTIASYVRVLSAFLTWCRENG